MDEAHKNVNQAKKDGIDSTQKYRFGIRFYSPGDDYKCFFSELNASSDLTNADKFWRLKKLYFSELTNSFKNTLELSFRHVFFLLSLLRWIAY